MAPEAEQARSRGPDRSPRMVESGGFDRHERGGGGDRRGRDRNQDRGSDRGHAVEVARVVTRHGRRVNRVERHSTNPFAALFGQSKQTKSSFLQTIAGTILSYR